MLGEPNVSYDMFGKNCQKETQITRENMKVLDRKMLTVRYHLKPLEYMLQHKFYEESSKEGMISIISVLTERQDSKVDNPQDTSRNSEVRPAVPNIILFC